MDHKLTVYAFSFSERARKNIIDVGGTVIGLDGLIGSYPDGKGVRVIG
jgi:large subunit ribosomal protein L18e